MTSFSELSQDAFVETLNIASGRVAARLHDLSGQHIEMTVPKLYISSIQADRSLHETNETELAIIWQRVTGDVTGQIMLTFAIADAQQLILLLMNKEAISYQNMDQSTRELLLEVGTLFLSNCLICWRQLWGLRLRPSQTEFKVASLQETLSSQKNESTILNSHIKFKLETGTIDGKLLFILPEESVQQIDATINKLLL